MVMPSCPAGLSGGSSAIASFTSSRVGRLLRIASGVEVSVGWGAFTLALMIFASCSSQGERGYSLSSSPRAKPFKPSCGVFVGSLDSSHILLSVDLLLRMCVGRLFLLVVVADS